MARASKFIFSCGLFVGVTVLSVAVYMGTAVASGLGGAYGGGVQETKILLSKSDIMEMLASVVIEQKVETQKETGALTAQLAMQFEHKFLQQQQQIAQQSSQLALLRAQNNNMMNMIAQLLDGKHHKQQPELEQPPARLFKEADVAAAETQAAQMQVQTRSELSEVPRPTKAQQHQQQPGPVPGHGVAQHQPEHPVARRAAWSGDGWTGDGPPPSAIVNASVWMKDERSEIAFGPMAETKLWKDPPTGDLRTNAGVRAAGEVKSDAGFCIGENDCVTEWPTGDAGVAGVAGRVARLESFANPVCETMRYLAGSCHAAVSGRNTAFLAKTGQLCSVSKTRCNPGAAADAPGGCPQGETCETEKCPSACITRLCGRKTTGGTCSGSHKSSETPFCRQGTEYENDAGMCHWTVSDSNGAAMPANPVVWSKSFWGNYQYGGGSDTSAKETVCCCTQKSNAGPNAFAGLRADNKFRTGGQWSNILTQCPMIEEMFGKCVRASCFSSSTLVTDTSGAGEYEYTANDDVGTGGSGASLWTKGDGDDIARESGKVNAVDGFCIGEDNCIA